MTPAATPAQPAQPDAPAPSPSSTSNHFADRLHAAITRAGSPACVGLDPVVDRLPAAIRKRHASAADQIEAFCIGVIEAVAGTVAIVKPQSACFERYGQSGLGALRRVVQSARSHNLVVILDAKRGDIGATAEHYAAAVFGPARLAGAHAERPTFAADAVTLNGYLGSDAVEPFLAHGDGGNEQGENGVFVLVRTSNPGSDAVQAARLADGRTVAELVADQVAALGRGVAGGLGACGLSRVGAVVGATKSSEAAALRARMPDQYLLVPGFGSQGGTVDNVRPMLRTTRNPGDAGVVVNASRSVIYSFQPDNPKWAESVGEAAKALVGNLARLFS